MSCTAAGGQRRLLPSEMPSSSIAPSHCDVTFPPNALLVVSPMPLGVVGDVEMESALLEINQVTNKKNDNFVKHPMKTSRLRKRLVLLLTLHTTQMCG